MSIDRYAKMIEWALVTYPDCNIFESLSPNQITSKNWMLNELSSVYYGDAERVAGGHNVEIVGSWYGYPMIENLLRNFEIRKIECWDIDKEARMIAKQYLEIFKNGITKIYSKEYFGHKRNGSEATILINTSSEHMVESFYMMNNMHNKNKFYVKDPLIVIQSNDMVHLPEHINCVGSADELIEKHRITEVLYAGEQTIVEWDGLEVNSTDYTRYMVIGRL